MSRPGSRKGKKGSAKLTPKQQIAKLTEQNEGLTAHLDTLTSQAEQLTQKVEAMTKLLVDSIKDKKEFGITDQTDIMQISVDTLVAMISKLVVKKQLQEMSVEARVEELETRVTQMSMDLAKMTKKTLAYENGLEDLAKYGDIEDVRDKVYQLQLIAGQEYHTFAYNDPAKNNEVLVNGVDERPNSAVRRSLENADKLNLIPPARKFVGDTHIKNMHRDLRLYIMKELSQEKASGADWRMLAERVGVDQETVDYLKSLKLECPMGRVFAEWGQSPSATVRLLHRHLMSPQMRCTILGKRVSDFYTVD